MRMLLTSLFLLVAAVVVALLLHRYPGAVTVEIGPWIIETSAAVGVALLLVVFAFLYALLRVLALAARGPRAIARGVTARRTEQERRRMVRGLIEMAEGRWEAAEKLLVRHVEGSETSLLNYLAAARAAQQIGAYERRDRYLRAAIEENPEADVAVSLTQAELQLAHEQYEHALATLTRLHGLRPRHTYVMKLLSRLYRKLEDWERLAELIPELRRRRVVSPEQLAALERETLYGRLRAAPAREEALVAIWEAVDQAYRRDATAMRLYVLRLREAGAADRAEQAVRQRLNREWDEGLARDYGLIEAADSARQLDRAESWLGEHGRSPMLLLTLGRLAIRNRLWGKARAYFESSLGVAPEPEAAHELAVLLEQLGETGAAREYYRQGIEYALAALGAGDGVDRRRAHARPVTVAEKELPAPVANA